MNANHSITSFPFPNRAPRFYRAYRYFVFFVNQINHINIKGLGLWCNWEHAQIVSARMLFVRYRFKPFQLRQAYNPTKRLFLHPLSNNHPCLTPDGRVKMEEGRGEMEVKGRRGEKTEERWKREDGRWKTEASA